MERQEADGVATEQLPVTGRSLLKGTGFGAAAVGTVPASATRPHEEIDYR
jgi:hypothetical protein